MDVNSIANNAMQSFLSDTQRQSSEIDKFQSVLDKAMENDSSVNKEEIMEACRSFESYFLQTMFREMRKTSLDGGGFTGKSNAEQIFTDMLDEEVSKSTAKAGGIGLAEMMYKQMSKEYATVEDRY